MRRLALVLILPAVTLLCLLNPGLAKAQPPATPIPVKVVVIAMFEPGEDTGDTPGEFQYWVERDHLDHVYSLPQGWHHVRMNDEGVLGIVTGVGATRAAASVMALGLDPRFDLTHAYWIVAGIAGIDPADGSLGSAVWSEYVVDGALARLVDPREMPLSWTTGYIPLSGSSPYELPLKSTDGIVYHLNPTLTEWAYQQTKSLPLLDSETMRQRRRQFIQPNAQRPPFVLKGAELSSPTFWHGRLLDQWANEWVRYYTEGHANFVTTAMEDTGTLESLTYLARANRVDIHRVLILRTASNYDQQRPGVTAADSLDENHQARYSGYIPALENAWRAGNTIVAGITSRWSEYRDHIPAAAIAGTP